MTLRHSYWHHLIPLMSLTCVVKKKQVPPRLWAAKKEHTPPRAGSAKIL
jgi:hypothetical protein